MAFATNCSFDFGGFDPHIDSLDEMGIRDDVNVVVIKIHSPQHPSQDPEMPKEMRRVVNNWIGDHWYLRSSNDEQFTFKFAMLCVDKDSRNLLFRMSRNITSNQR